MATQTIRVNAPGLAAGSYTANVQADGSNTNAFTGRTLTAEANASFWTFTVTSATAGLYAFQILNGSSAVVAYGWFYSGTDSAVTIQDSNSRDEALHTQRLGTPSGASIAADIAAVKSGVDDLPTNAELVAALVADGNLQLVEGYAGAGVVPSRNQAILMLLAHHERADIEGTTKTVFKIDGVTTAATLTLDDASSPTSIRRAT